MSLILLLTYFSIGLGFSFSSISIEWGKYAALAMEPCPTVNSLIQTPTILGSNHAIFNFQCVAEVVK